MRKSILPVFIIASVYTFAQKATDSIKDEKNIEEVIIVASSRTHERIENSPQKIEVLGKEEMTEESSIKPAGIGSILGDISGVQIQQNSAVSGNSNVRIQGLDGRYTQILRDGMVLFDGYSGSLGVLSIPPLDLQQIELIKGSASTLYGGGAIGGLVNIISRKPSERQELTALMNYSTLDESNLNFFASKKYKDAGYTFFAGYTRQRAQDVNKDGFSDIPKIRSLVIHPRLFFYPFQNTVISLGWTGSFDQNKGGDMQVLNHKADSGHQYFEQNKLQRNSFELLYDQKFRDRSRLEFKNSMSNFNRKFTDTDNFLNAHQINYFSELSYVRSYDKMIWVLGTDFQGYQFNPESFEKFHIPKFENNSFGFFFQNTLKLDNTIIETGLRNDVTNNYGSFLLPSIAIIYHIDKHWATRGGIGLGYKIPNALAPQTVDYPLENLMLVDINHTKAEKSVGYNLEFNYKKKFDDGNEFFLNQAFFLTEINNPVIAEVQADGNVYFSNQHQPVVSKGFDTYIKSKLDGWELYLGYTYTIAKYKFQTGNQFIPLTAQNRAATTVVKDFEKGWKFGLEASYTGHQYRMDYTRTPGYIFGAAMISKELDSHFTVVLNCENVLDYRQSRKEELYTGTILNPVFKPLWAPIDGRVLNISLKWKL